jgi:hypothetical protein
LYISLHIFEKLSERNLIVFAQDRDGGNGDISMTRFDSFNAGTRIFTHSRLRQTTLFPECLKLSGKIAR